MRKACRSSLTDLAVRLKEYGETIELISGPASALILPRGGRILGVDLGKGNMLWVNPKIEEVLEHGEWNTGGIRTWVSPERAFFYDDPKRFKGWRCPPSIDPANYRVVAASKNCVKLQSRILARDMIFERDLDGTMIRDLRILSVKQVEKPDSLRMRVGIRDILNLRGYESPFALWTLIQVDPGESGRGTVTVPVAKGARPIHYFGPIPDYYLRLTEEEVEFALDGKKELKLGIRPEDLSQPREAKLDYNFKMSLANASVSVLSKTAANTQSECVDPARADPDGPRAAIQIYNSEKQKSGLCFGELEIQGAAATIEPNGTATAREEVTIDFVQSLSVAHSLRRAK